MSQEPDKASRILIHWHEGHDTLYIARAEAISEAEVYNTLHRCREAARLDHVRRRPAEGRA